MRCTRNLSAVSGEMGSVSWGLQAPLAVPSLLSVSAFTEKRASRDPVRRKAVKASMATTKSPQRAFSASR